MDASIDTPQVSDGLFEMRLDQLAGLSEAELLTVIGVESVTPIEYHSAIIYAYANGEHVAAFEGMQLITRMPVDLVSRGRRTVERIIADWGDELRSRICPLRKKTKDERELAVNIAPLLVSLLAVHAWVAAAIALFIVRYLLDKLCEGWQSAVKTFVV